MTEQLTADERKHVAWANDRVWLKALRNIDTLTRERDEARAECAAKADILRASVEVDAEFDVKFSALEAEVTRLTDELKAAELRRDAAETGMLATEARVRELEEDNNVLRTDVYELGKRREKAESRLAAATELPRRIWEAMGELTSYLVDGDHMVRVDHVRGVFERFLAAQPAAPGSVLSDGTWLRTPEEERAQPAAPVVCANPRCGMYGRADCPDISQPAAPVRTHDPRITQPTGTSSGFVTAPVRIEAEECPVCYHEPPCVRRAEAEQAVLDACWSAMIVTDAPDEFLAESSEREIRLAIEAWRLARRGLKP